MVLPVRQMTSSQGSSTFAATTFECLLFCSDCRDWLVYKHDDQPQSSYYWPIELLQESLYDMQCEDYWSSQLDHHSRTKKTR